MKLYPHQEEAIEKLKNGNILLGDIGSGKSLTSLVYYKRKVCNDMTEPRALYIITTAKKRDSYEWEKDIQKAELDLDNITIDSWNNIKKYVKVIGAFFIFDEQRLVGSGAWVKSFWKIAQHNRWILLTATPGDKWEDFFPVFKANGFYKTKTEFKELHMIYDPYCRYRVKGYMHTGILLKYKKQIIVEMRYKREANRVTQNYICDYDKEKEKFILRNRWDIFKEEPIQQAASLCYVLRRLVNTNEDRIKKLNGIYATHKKMIIFYNFDYELDMLRKWCEEKHINYSEWNGHNHQEVLDKPDWVYLVQYAAGNEGWNCITCDTIVFYSLNYSYKVTKQAEGRIDRMNSPFSTLYYFYLTSRSKIDTAIQLALYKKKKFNETAFSKIF